MNKAKDAMVVKDGESAAGEVAGGTGDQEDAAAAVKAESGGKIKESAGSGEAGGNLHGGSCCAVLCMRMRRIEFPIWVMCEKEYSIVARLLRVCQLV